MEPAISTLVHYFKTVFEAAGLNWTSENEEDIAEAVRDIVNYAVERSEAERS